MFTIKRKKRGGNYILYIAIILVIVLASTYFYQESQKEKKATIIAEEKNKEKITNEEKEKQNREKEEKENKSKVVESAENNNQKGSAESNTNTTNGEGVAAVEPEQNPTVAVPTETNVPTGVFEQAPVAPVEVPTLIVSTNPYDQAYNAEGLLKEINYKQSDDNQIYMNPVSFFDKALTLPEIIKLTDKENREDIEGLEIEYEGNKIQITIEKPIPFGDGSYIIGEFGYYVNENENDKIDKYDNADIKFLDSNLHLFAFLIYEENRSTHEETYKSLGRNYTHESGRCEIAYYDSTAYQITHTCYPKSGIVKFPGDGTYSIE